MGRGARIAGAVFLLTWVPLAIWRGMAMGRTLRLGGERTRSSGPIIEGIIQMAAIMLAPAAFAALIAFVLWAWREEHR